MDLMDDEICWICLCGQDAAGEDETVRVCGCPRVCHKRCLGRWQLQNAGKREEKYCRFCDQKYPDWRNSLTPGEITPSTPVMAVSVRGKVYKLRVRPGPEGKEDFKRQIRQLLGFSADMDFDVIFECKTPHNGAEKVQLHGFEAFEAASWCAAVSAAKRKKAKLEKAAKAAAAAAAAGPDAAGSSGSNGGSSSALATTVSCPAALDSVSAGLVNGGSNGGSNGSSGGGSDSGGSTASLSDTGSDGGGGSNDAQQRSSRHGLPVSGSSLTHRSAFARDQRQVASSNGSSHLAAVAAAATQQQQHRQQLPSLPSSGSLGPYGLEPAGSSYLLTAGSSLPHAIIEEPMPASPAAGAAAVVADVAPQRGTDQDSCPNNQGTLVVTAAGTAAMGGGGGDAVRARAAAGPQLSSAMSVPVVGSTGAMAIAGRSYSSNSSRTGRSSDSGVMAAAAAGSSSSSDGGREEGGERKGKVARWLRRLLLPEGPWRTAMPASMFMGII